MKNIFSLLALSVLLLVTLDSNTLPAQELALEWSIPGTAAQGFFDVFWPSIGLNLDFNRDGVPDKPFINTMFDDQAVLYIVSGADPDTRWNIPVPQLSLNFEKYKTTGFYEMDGDQGTTEIIFASKEGKRFGAPVILSYELINVQVTSYSILASTEYFLLGIFDTDDDGKAEIIVANTAARMVEVWGF